MGFWSWQLQVWRRAVRDAWHSAVPHTLLATLRLGAVLILTTLAMLVANQWLHIVDRGLMSEDNIKDNLITLGVFVPIALVILFVGLVVVEGLLLVPYKMWKEAGGVAAQIKSPSQRVPISAIRDHAVMVGWTLGDQSAASSNDSYELSKRLQQSVIDGEQPLWGRLRLMPGTISPLVHDPLPEQLKTHQIDPYSFRFNQPNDRTGTRLPGLMESKIGVTYDDLHVDLAKAKAWLDQNRKAP